MNSLYVSCHSTGIITALGVLYKINRNIEHISIWNVTSCGSLILFMRCMGFTYKQTIDILSDNNELFNYFHYSSLTNINQKDNLNTIKIFLIDILNLNDIFNENVTLEEVFRLTNIFPCFIVFDKNLKSIINLNPIDYGKYKFLDCVLASLTYMGIYEEYIYKDHKFSNVLVINPYPSEYFYNKTPAISIIQNDLCYFEKNIFSNVLYTLLEEQNNRLNIALKNKDISNVIVITGFILPVYNKTMKLFFNNYGIYLGHKFLKRKLSYFTWEKNIN